MSSMKTARPAADGASSLSLEPYTTFPGLYKYTPTLLDSCRVPVKQRARSATLNTMLFSTASQIRGVESGRSDFTPLNMMAADPLSDIKSHARAE